MFSRTPNTSRRNALGIVATGLVCLLVLLAVHHVASHSDGGHRFGDAACPLCTLLTSLFIVALPVLPGCVDPARSILRAGRCVAAPPSYLWTTCLRRGPPASAF